MTNIDNGVIKIDKQGNVKQNQDKASCFTAGGKLRGIGITIPEATETKFMQLTKDFRIRRLTPKECQRLQTVPEWYSWGNTSDTQIYRMLGNEWSIEVIKHILSYSNLNKK